MTISLGASAAEQATRFAFCLLIGVAAGIFALLYLRKASFFERALTDLFATLALGAGFLLCVEYALGGKFELYGLVAYALGAAALPSVFSLIKKAIRKRAKNKK